ncbi:unnamed protein product [Strongylus vulgaris]|uniref:PTHB1 N-terminal domain-containing protein n=1 Tax=Strongylus vulgaris TaxID=40348 RepID=A0A3P7ILZ1_STRVU|nr:unnamed protein product [Strongylus vulgaris]
MTTYDSAQVDWTLASPHDRLMKNDQVIVGGEDGVVIVLDPGGVEKEPVLIEQQIGKPVIDIIIGEFLPSVGAVGIFHYFLL